MLILWEQMKSKNFWQEWFKKERLIVNINDDKMELDVAKYLEKYDNFMLINFKLETERINIKKTWIAKADKRRYRKIQS